MMEREEFDNLESKLSNGEQSRLETHESDNAWQFKSVPEEESEKWKMEKERYDEVIEYIREVDEILNLIKPFPREGNAEKSGEPLFRSVSQTQSPRFGLDHLENIIKLVEQLKELQENNYKLGERTCYLKDLKKLREHKERLKNEETEMRNKLRIRSITTPDENEICLGSRKNSSTSEKLEHEPKENLQEKRKSICLGENRSKVSKWTKVKEAFHWEKTSAAPKALKRENSTGEKNLQKSEEASPDGSSVDVFCSPPAPPPPPPPPLPPRFPRPEDLLCVRPAQDLPSSSSSDRLDEFLSFSEMKDLRFMIKENKTDPDSPNHPFGTDDTEEGDTVTRKFSCEEFVQHLTKEELATSRSTKSNKTTWGKVKDIIQTRKDSLKKKPKKRGSDEFKKRRKLSTVSNPQFSDQFEDLSSPEDKVKNMEIIPKPAYDFSDETVQSMVEEKSAKRLTPALTITLPSTEELRSFCCDETDRKENAEEDGTNILSQFSCQAQYCEDKSKFGKNKSGSNQRLSRWIKVKRVFLTSAAPARSPQYLPVSSSSPTSQNKSSGFFSDLESDDLSSGEWIDDKSPSQEKQKPGYPEPQSVAMTLIQEDIRKSYNELQKKLSQEFDQKMREWEVKTEAPTRQDDSCSRVKGDDGDCIPKFRKSRDSIAVPLPNLNDLSPEFKKKLNDWKKMKTSQSSSSVSSSATKDEIQVQNIKIRIGEWQPWRSRCSGKGTPKGYREVSEEYSKKFEEGQRSCGSSRPPANRRKNEERGFSCAANQRGLKKRESIKKLSHSRTSSGGDSLISTSSAEKDGRFIRRSQKVKDFHWVEKELQKIEREKLRLEQEKEKYLEREARLEKMKKTMGTSPTQEILVRTPEGFFRFKGISQKFTKKLYEWEKARGIAPEASTFALLEASAQTGVNADADVDGVMMQRSKSTGSVPELSSALLIQAKVNHSSSLSLNDVDELKLEEEESISLEMKEANEEPEAVIVDVEDIEEETAVLAEGSPFQSETPIYTYTSEEIDKITESRGRFYLSNEFDFSITEERKRNRTADSSTKDSGISQSNENGRGEAELGLEKFENEAAIKLPQNFLADQNIKNSIIFDDATKSFQETKEETFEDPFHMSTIINSGFVKPKMKDVYDLKMGKTESSEVTELESPSPLTQSSSQRSFSQGMNKTANMRPPSSELSFVSRKSTQDSVQTKADPQVLKRKIKEKITLLQRLSTEASWKCSDFDFKRSNETDKVNENEKAEKLQKKAKTEIPLENDSQNGNNELKKRESISVFVPTTRKIISPVKTSDGATPSVCSYVIDDVKPENQDKLEQNETNQIPLLRKSLTSTQNDLHSYCSNSTSPISQRKLDPEIIPKGDIGMPPLPNSPKTFKKLNPKETAPSIRMIIAKYNQKISEHDNAEGKRTESGSPIWRSPVFGRRTQEKIERFSGKNGGSGRRNGEVQKSASLDSMRAKMTNSSSLMPPQDHEPQIKGILKSNSVGVMKVRPQNYEAQADVTLAPDSVKETSPSVLRAMKIQKAKEDFLSGRLKEPSEVSAVSAKESSPSLETQIMITQSEAETEQSLVKSVSAETITGEVCRTDGHLDKMPDARPLLKSSSKFDISSIKSKFRKIRLRKDKDPKLNAVAVLCRQSLFIDVPKPSESSTMSKSCPSSPVMDRNKHEKSCQPSKK